MAAPYIYILKIAIANRKLRSSLSDYLFVALARFFTRASAPRRKWQSRTGCKCKRRIGPKIERAIAISLDEIQNVYDGSIARGYSFRSLTRSGIKRKDINDVPWRKQWGAWCLVAIISVPRVNNHFAAERQLRRQWHSRHVSPLNIDINIPAFRANYRIAGRAPRHVKVLANEAQRVRPGNRTHEPSLRFILNFQDNFATVNL